jgi:hypothetical protein
MKALFPYLSMILIAFVVLGSCQKDKDDVLFKGLVQDPNQEIAIGDVVVKLYTKKMSSGSYNFNFEFEKSTVTDASGAFEISIPTQYISDYKFVFIRDQYFESELEYTSEDLAAVGNDLGVVDLFPQASLSIHIKNKYPVNGSDELRFHVRAGAYPCPTCCGTDYQIFTGSSVDTEFECQVEGGAHIQLEWFVLKNGVTTPHIQEFDVLPFAVFPVEILY